MPDLTIINEAACESATQHVADVEGSAGRMYRVWFDRTPKGPYQYGWSCECKAFEFGGGKPCKHIATVKANYCGWRGMPSQLKDGACPSCGRKAIIVPTGA